MEQKIEFEGKMYGVIVVAIADKERDYNGVVMKMLKQRGIQHTEMLSPILHHSAYNEAYHFLTQFALDNNFRYLIADSANGVIRTMRADGSEYVTRVVRLVELDQKEIHAKSESKKRALEAQKEGSESPSEKEDRTS